MTSQSCAECGTRAEPGQSFCDACGAVLSWSERESAPRGGAADPVAVPAGESAGAVGTAGTAGTRREEPRPVSSGASTAPAPGRDTFFSPRPGDAGAPRREPARTEEEPEGSDERLERLGERLERLDERLDQRLDQRLGERPDERLDEGPEAPEGADDDTLPQPAVPAAPPVPAGDPAPAPDSPDDTAARVRSLLVPVSDPEPRAAPEPSVAPVLPGRPVADRPQVRAPGRDPGVQGGLPCPWCATPNMPDRHFCVRCAMPMSGHGPDQPALRRPWWRRLLDLRNGERPWAGDRPRLRRGFGRVLNWVVGALVLTLVIVAVMNVGDAVNGVRDHFAKRAPVDPDKVTASRSYPGHKPELLFDKRSNTWWGPGVAQSGEGEWIEVRFTEPTRLLDVMITPGVSARAETITESALPKRIGAEITMADGTKTTRVLTLDQGAGPQSRAFRVGSVSAVRFVLRSAHAASAEKQVAIAEIEFFGRSNASGS
uniref:Zinc ribbon domain-containing protein n=1 Tax=Streptomyces sp. NBC_00093 TaxID=2975649 RepID=A0AAU2A9A9_9ACTN